MANITLVALKQLLTSCFGLAVFADQPLNGALKDIDDAIIADCEAAAVSLRCWISLPQPGGAVADFKFQGACVGALKLISQHRGLGVAPVVRGGALLLKFAGLSIKALDKELTDRGADFAAYAAAYAIVIGMPLDKQALFAKWATAVAGTNGFANATAAGQFKAVVTDNATFTAQHRLANLALVVDAAGKAGADAKLLPGNAFDGCQPGTEPLQRTVPCAGADAIVDLHDRLPPGSKFGGFAGWGKADYANPDECKLSHFKKHVLRAPKAKADDDKTEQPKWWKQIGIALPLDEARKAGMQIIDGTPEAAWFDGATKLLKEASIEAFLDSGKLELCQPLVDWFVNRHMEAYSRIALDASKSCDLAYAFTFKESAMVACFKDDKFIVGRVHAGQVAMSSCYIPDKLAEKKQSTCRMMLWPLRTV